MEYNPETASEAEKEEWWQKRYGNIDFSDDTTYENNSNIGLTDEGNAIRPFAGASDPKNFPYGVGFGPNGWNRIAYDTNAILEYPFDRVTTGEFPDETHLAEKPDYYKSKEWKSYNSGNRLEYLADIKKYISE
jgi:hypothetical protein